MTTDMSVNACMYVVDARAVLQMSSFMIDFSSTIRPFLCVVAKSWMVL